MLRAAGALQGQNPMTALGALSGVREQRDTPPLALFLRGASHLAGRHDELAAEDFAAITSHRGRAFLSGAAIFAPALSELAHARRGAGDLPGSERALRQLGQVYAGDLTGISLGERRTPRSQR